MSSPAPITTAVARALLAKPAKRNKYGACRTTVDDITFDSAAEARRWRHLQMMVKAKLIHDLRRQVAFNLEVAGVLIAIYRADFVYREVSDGSLVVEDCKGFRTPEYKLKAKLMQACHGITIREVA